MWYSIATVGHLEIDLDHANIDLMLHLYDVEQDPKDSMLRIVPAFLAHMIHEEKVIKRTGLKIPENHKKEHSRLSILLRSYETDLIQGKMDGRQFAAKVQNTLKIHVMDFDMKLFERFECYQ